MGSDESLERPMSVPVVNMADRVAEEYKKLIHNKMFLEVVVKATPYPFLDSLKIGPRPSKRQSGSNELRMRVIPWVFCWTQVRILFPVWWGIGHFWSMATEQEKVEIRSAYSSSRFLQTFLKTLGYTLSKVELSIFKLYLVSDFSNREAEKIYESSSSELESVKKFFTEITGEQNLLWFRKWLESSISYRSPMLHSLNIIQILAIERKDVKLLREATTSIACGMLTTG